MPPMSIFSIIHYHEVYCGYFVLRHFFYVSLVFAATEDAAEYFGVKCLDTSAENGGICGYFFNFLCRDSPVLR